jgi:DNA sulfur modification protein DndE
MNPGTRKSALLCGFAAGAVLAAAAGPTFAQAAEAPKFTAAQATALEGWSYSLALQAATYADPIVIMYLLRYNDSVGPKPKAAPNSLWRMENITTPQLAEEEGYVLPNTSTVYGFGFLDLRQEPVILTLPDSDGRYYMVETVDMWTNAFAYPVGAAAGYKGGTFAMVGPGWQGTLPDGVKRIDCPTPWVLIQPRVEVYLNGKIDLAGAKAILGGIKSVGLAEFTRQPAPPTPKIDYPAPERINLALPVSTLDFRDPLQFWDIFSAAMNENPPPEAQVKALLPMFQPLGIELGKTWDRSKVDPLVLRAMARAAQAIPSMMADQPVGRLSNHWFIPPPTIGDPQTDYRIRAIVATVGLTANTPKEAIYFDATQDMDGRILTGARRYTITFRETPPFNAPGFWSLAMYGLKNSYPVANPVNRYVLGSDNKESLEYNKDGSLTIYLQTHSPGKEKEANWLPAPSGPFRLILRSYAPGEAMVESLTDPTAYVPPPVVAVD